MVENNDDVIKNLPVLFNINKEEEDDDDSSNFRNYEDEVKQNLAIAKKMMQEDLMYVHDYEQRLTIITEYISIIFELTGGRSLQEVYGQTLENIEKYRKKKKEEERKERKRKERERQQEIYNSMNQSKNRENQRARSRAHEMPPRGKGKGMGR